MTERDPGQARLLTPGYRRLFVLTMFLVCFFNFADRAVFSVLAQTIKADLGLTDFQLGLLQGLAFALLYAAFGLPIGLLAERVSRLRIVAAATAIWSAATVASGLAASFGQLMLARLAVGMGEAGFTPPTASLVSDLVPRERRASTMALIMLGTPAGTVPRLGRRRRGRGRLWLARRLPRARGPGPARRRPGRLLLLTEPDRGLAEGAPPGRRPAPPFGEFLRTLRGNRSLCLVIAGGGLAGFGMTSISQFLAVFLARVHEMGVAEAGAFYGSISGIALAIGLLVGSFGTDRLSRRDLRWPAWGARDRARRRALPLLGGVCGGEPLRRFDPAGAGRIDAASVLRPDHGHDPEPAAAEDARHRRGALSR